MKAFTCDQFKVPLPEWHRFPMVKYTRLRERLEQADWFDAAQILTPRRATDDELLRVHSLDYLTRVKSGLLTPDEVRYLGFPWTPLLVERSRRSVGATIEACLAAIDDGVAVNLAGGHPPRLPRPRAAAIASSTTPPSPHAPSRIRASPSGS